MYEAGDVRVEDVADPSVEHPTDALVRITHSCICGSDLWPYKSMPATEIGSRIGHEFLGVIEDVGPEVDGFKAGDMVLAPFAEDSLDVPTLVRPTVSVGATND